MTELTLPGDETACPPWCAEHFPEIGVCEAAPVPAPGGEVRMCADPDAGIYVSLFCETQTLTPTDAEQLAYALLTMAARARGVSAKLLAVA